MRGSIIAFTRGLRHRQPGGYAGKTNPKSGFPMAGAVSEGRGSEPRQAILARASSPCAKAQVRSGVPFKRFSAISTPCITE